jgi:hypothetical protein
MSGLLNSKVFTLNKMKKTQRVLKEDLENPLLDVLPVRKGCGSVLCACHGGCRAVVGHISRFKYEHYLKTKKELEEFLENNIIYV